MEQESKLFVLVPCSWHFATAPIKWEFILIAIKRKRCCQSVLSTLPFFFAMLCISSVKNNPDLPPGILQTKGLPGVTGTRIRFYRSGWTLLSLINVLLCLTRYKWLQWPVNESQKVLFITQSQDLSNGLAACDPQYPTLLTLMKLLWHMVWPQLKPGSWKSSW